MMLFLFNSSASFPAVTVSQSVLNMRCEDQSWQDQDFIVLHNAVSGSRVQMMP